MTATARTHEAALLAVLQELVWSLEAVAARGGKLAEQAGKEAVRHAKERDRVRDRLRRSGTEASNPAPAWNPDFLRNTKAARTRIAELETQLLTIHLARVGSTAGADRVGAIDDVLAAAIAAAAWGVKPQAFPGLD